MYRAAPLNRSPPYRHPVISSFSPPSTVFCVHKAHCRTLRLFCMYSNDMQLSRCSSEIEGMAGSDVLAVQLHSLRYRGLQKAIITDSNSYKKIVIFSFLPSVTPVRVFQGFKYLFSKTLHAVNINTRIKVIVVIFKKDDRIAMNNYQLFRRTMKVNRCNEELSSNAYVNRLCRN